MRAKKNVLFCQVGGSLGLFLGLSLVACFDAVSSAARFAHWIEKADFFFFSPQKYFSPFRDDVQEGQGVDCVE